MINDDIKAQIHNVICELEALREIVEDEGDTMTTDEISNVHKSVNDALGAFSWWFK